MLGYGSPGKVEEKATKTRKALQELKDSPQEQGSKGLKGTSNDTIKEMWFKCGAGKGGRKERAWAIYRIPRCAGMRWQKGDPLCLVVSWSRPK